MWKTDENVWDGTQMVYVVSRMVWLVMWGNEQNLKGGHAIVTGHSLLMPGFYPKPAYVM